MVSKKKRSSPKLKVIFRPTTKIQRFFPPKLRWSPKKKKKKVFTEIESNFSAEIRNIYKGLFRPKLGGLQKKKKRSSPKLRVIFRPTTKIQRFLHPKLGGLQKKKKKRSSPKLRVIFRPISQIQTFEGGLFSVFHKKSASKAQKTCDFAYFTSQWGGSSPPHPPWLRY